jgi:hypothetical protein
MVIVLVLSVVGHEFERWSGHTEKCKLIFDASSAQSY